jgi:hypothetical protein
MNQTIFTKEERAKRDVQITNNDIAHEKSLLNKFVIFDEEGNLKREGHNILLNTGRKINALKLMGVDTAFTASEMSDGIARTIIGSTSCATTKFVGWGIGNGAAPAAGLFTVAAPLPSDTGFTGGGQLYFFAANTSKPTSSDGTPYLNNTRIKQHITATNPVAKLDTDGFIYYEHTLVIQPDENLANYFNEVILFVEYDAAGTKVYIPYSKFSFASLPNITSGVSTKWTIVYGIYL